jgi:starvation-inducible DNA-binding protein
MDNQRPSDNKRRRTVERAQPLLGQRTPEIQPYGTVADYPLALDAQARVASVDVLNQIVADTMVLRDLYTKHHWLVAGHTF